MSSAITDVLAAGTYRGAGAYNFNVARQNATTDNALTDTVQLSEAERVYQLHDQGQPVSQIANSLSLSVAAVNSYLEISSLR